MRKTFLTMTALSALVLISPALNDTATAGPGFKPAIRIKPQIRVKIDRTRLAKPKKQVRTARVPRIVPADTKPRKPLKTAKAPAIAPATRKAEHLPEQHAAPTMVSAPLPRQRPQIASDGTDKDPNFGGIDVAALLLLRPDRPGAGDAPDKGGKAGNGSIGDLLGLNGPDDRAGSTGGGWDPLASADDLGGSSRDPLAGIDGLDDTLWDPLGGVDDRTGSADGGFDDGTGSAEGGWDPFGGLDDALGDDYDWQSAWQDDSGWDMDGGGGSGKIEIDPTTITADGNTSFYTGDYGMDAIILGIEEPFDFTDDPLVADDVTSETATANDFFEALRYMQIGHILELEAHEDADDDPDDDDDTPVTDDGDSTPVPIEVGDTGVATDAAGNPIAPDLDSGDIDPAPEVDDLAGGRVVTDATGNPFDPNVHGGDIDPAPDADTDQSGSGEINQGQIGGDIDWDYET